IIAAAKFAKASIDLRVFPGDQSIHLSINVANLPPDRKDSADIRIAITEDDLQSNVARGENAGRKLTHIGVVRTMKSIGTISRTDATFTRELDLKLDPTWHSGKLKIIAFVQHANLGSMLAAQSVSIVEAKK
ncbi:MAG TPA: DUF1223 domain-containing protein, partial [Tepidisphaeraceae bacterium]|nr:DUF1223 domain-containing protein [Tepidisphaeraceae bacterium]